MIKGHEPFYMLALLSAALLSAQHFILIEKYAYLFIVFFGTEIIGKGQSRLVLRAFQSQPIIALFIFAVYLGIQAPWSTIDCRGLRDVLYQFVYIFLLVGMAVAYSNRPLPASFLIFVAAVPFFYSAYYLVPDFITPNPNQQIYAYTIFSFIPFLILEIERNNTCSRMRPTTLGILAVTAITLFVVFKTRIPSIAIVVFGLGIYSWRFFTHSEWRINVLFSITILLLLAGIVAYVYLMAIGVFSDIDKISEVYFQKGVSGRGEIWPELLLQIMDKPILGRCSTCSTELYENFAGTRNLSSHNTFLEITFRTGIIGLGLLIYLYFSLFKHFYRYRGVPSAKVGGAFLIAVMLFQSSGELMFFNAILPNVLIWAFWGVCIGRTLRETAV